MRGVLLNLLEDGDQTVPQLARRRPVSRQHVQALVNELLSRGMVERKPNPAHRRSKLVSLTPAGRRAITAMLEREVTILRGLPLDSSPGELLDAADLLSRFRSALRDPEWRAQFTEV